MHRLTSLALIGLLTGALAGCGDDDDGPAMNGGTSGSSTTMGGGGMTGMAGSTMAGSMMTGGTTTGGTTTTPPTEPFTGIATCTGCVEVEVPVSGANSAANVLDQVGFPFFYTAPGQDFSNVTVTWRVMALENNPGLMVAPYAENGAPYDGVYANHIALSVENFPPGEWVDVVFDLSLVPFPIDTGVPLVDDAGLGGADAGSVVDAGEPGGEEVAVADAGGDADAAVADAGVVGAPDASVGSAGGGLINATFMLIDPAFDKRLIEQLGIYVGSNADLVGDAVAKVAIDSVTFSGTPERPDVTFSMGLEGFTMNTYNAPPDTQGPLLHP